MDSKDDRHTRYRRRAARHHSHGDTMTDTTARELIQRLADALEALQKEAVTTPHNQIIVVGGVAHPIPIGNDLLARDALHAHLLDRARAYLAQPEPEGLPPNYIDSEHTGYDRELLEVFYRACRSEGGSADEIHLRGLKAVIALSQPEPEEPVAWMYLGEPSYDGRHWHDRWEVTLDEKLARFLSGHKEPVPLWRTPAINPAPQES